MRLGQLEVRPGGYLGPPRRVLVRRHLEPGEFDLHSRKLGLVLVLDRQRVVDVLGVCLAHVHGQLRAPFMLHPAPLMLHPGRPVNRISALPRAHLG